MRKAIRYMAFVLVGGNCAAICARHCMLPQKANIYSRWDRVGDYPGMVCVSQESQDTRTRGMLQGELCSSWDCLGNFKLVVAMGLLWNALRSPEIIPGYP